MIQDHKMWLRLHFPSTYCNPSLSQIGASSLKIKIQSITQAESRLSFILFGCHKERSWKREKKSEKIFIIRKDLNMRQPQNIAIIPSPVIYQLFHLEVHVLFSGYMYISWTANLSILLMVFPTPNTAERWDTTKLLLHTNEAEVAGCDFSFPFFNSFFLLV